MEFVVKSEKWIDAIFGVPALAIFGVSILFGGSTRDFFRSHLYQSILVSIGLFIVAFLLIRKSIRSSIKMKVNEDGIYLEGLGFYQWSSIDFCYFSKSISADGICTSLFHVKLFGRSDQEVIVSANFFNQTENAIKKAIKSYSGNRSVNVVLSSDS